MTTYSTGDKLKCVERELRYRKYVYPNRVADGKMTQDEATRQTEIMEAIVWDYTRRLADEEPSLL
jgi:hypothetical protein